MTPAELAEVKSLLHSINAFAELLECQQSRVPLNKLMDMNAFSMERFQEAIAEYDISEDADEVGTIPHPPTHPPLTRPLRLFPPSTLPLKSRTHPACRSQVCTDASCTDEHHSHDNHGHAQHGHEQHGHDEHGHAQPEQHGHEEHGHAPPTLEHGHGGAAGQAAKKRKHDISGVGSFALISGGTRHRPPTRASRTASLPLLTRSLSPVPLLWFTVHPLAILTPSSPALP